MLNPSTLFFGAPEPELALAKGAKDDYTEDPACAQTDLSQQTEQHSREESLDDSWDERSRRPSIERSEKLPRHPDKAMMAPPGLSMLGDEDDDDDEGSDDECSRHSSGDPGTVNSLGDANGSICFSDLPSIGSVNHFNGTCDRCCFHPKGRCLNGYNCQHCHFDHEKRKRKNKKKNKAKKLQAQAALDDVQQAKLSAPMSPTEFSVVSTCASSQPTPSGSFPASSPLSGSYAFLQGLTEGTGTFKAQLGGESQWSVQPEGDHSAVDGGYPPSALQDPAVTLFGGGSTAGFPSALTAGTSSFLHGLDLEASYSGDWKEEQKDEYIRRLEAENQYLRSCLIQCLGLNDNGVAGFLGSHNAGLPTPPAHASLLRPTATPSFY